MNDLSPKALPIILLLYYDDFRKYRLAPGQCGGLYISFLNMDRDMISKPENIFCVGLVHSDDEYWSVMQGVINELVELFEERKTKCALVPGRMVTIRVRLGIFLADTPQRQDTCAMKRQNAIMNCICCMSPKEYGRSKYTKRTVPLSRQHWEEWLQSGSTERKHLEAEFGIKPIYVGQVKNKKTGIREGGSFLLNPFYKAIM